MLGACGEQGVQEYSAHAPDTAGAGGKCVFSLCRLCVSVSTRARLLSCAEGVLHDTHAIKSAFVLTCKFSQHI